MPVNGKQPARGVALRWAVTLGLTASLSIGGHALLASKVAETSADVALVKAAVRERELIAGGLSEMVRELERRDERRRQTTAILGRLLVTADVAAALLIGFGIALPMVRRLRDEIRRRDRANRLLEERTRELERSREDAVRARLEAECGREAAWTLVAIVRSSGDGIIGLALDGTITSWNAAAEALYGYRLEYILGKPLDLLVPPARKGEVAALLEHVRSRDSVVRMESERVRADGGIVHVWVTLSAVRDADGRVIGASSIDRDVSEKRQAEERFRIAVEAAPAAMIMVGADGRIVLANVQAERLFGYTRAELVGLPVDALVPARARAELTRDRTAVLAQPMVRTIGAGRDLTALRKDGSEVPVEIGLNPLVVGDDTYVLSAIIDISERKRAADALAHQAAELQRSNKELEQFAYVASHDLQEPLRMVASYVQLLARRYRGRLDADADEFIAYAVEGVERMRALIDDLLSLSRVGSRGVRLAEVACADALEAALANLRVAIAEAGAVVTHDRLPAVVADRGLLVHLLQNLIGNAVKFRGAEAPRVHVGVERRPGRWVLSVRDNGIGIDPRHGDRIFQVFQRLHTRERYPGTGIGLALCRKIVECHGGTISVRSVPGKGSTFFFTLPDAPAGRRAAGAALGDAPRAG